MHTTWILVLLNKNQVQFVDLGITEGLYHMDLTKKLDFHVQFISAYRKTAGNVLFFGLQQLINVPSLIDRIISTQLHLNKCENFHSLKFIHPQSIHCKAIRNAFSNMRTKNNKYRSLNVL